MKIGFNKDGLTLNSKKFNPLDMTVNGYGIETDYLPTQVDPFELLASLGSAKTAGEEVTKLDKIKILQSIIKK